ncbi:FYDLN acid domain-containing protein [Acidisoma cladoniae]|jgi:hypothetical protein|uniref:FYDLN acid domain-containing protein n=1 Tax=Acidisoma cladoniae TaxID=3040935 RepID=UPI00254A3796|nr:FYDLN acid domain-containing protein [Acidisoma sp. PAMC 29798]
MVAAALGAKRTCSSCGTRFFDLGKPQPLCPKCGVMQAAEVARLKPGTYKPFDKKAKALEISHVEAPAEAADDAEDEEEEDEVEKLDEDDDDSDVVAEEIVGGAVGKDDL